jgi:hypothetical protein
MQKSKRWKRQVNSLIRLDIAPQGVCFVSKNRCHINFFNRLPNPVASLQLYKYRKYNRWLQI